MTNDTNPRTDLPLSRDACERRDALLPTLQAEVRRRGRRRQIRQRACVAAALVITGGFALWLSVPGTKAPIATPLSPIAANSDAPTVTDQLHTETRNERSESAPPSRNAPTIRIVSSDPSITDRLSSGVTRASDSFLAQAIDDDELIRILRGSGQPYGLIRTQGRTLLASEIPDDHAPDESPPTSQKTQDVPHNRV